LEPDGDPVVLLDGELSLPVPDGEPGAEHFLNIIIQIILNVNENYWRNGHLKEDWSQMVIQQDWLMASFHCLCLMGSLELNVFFNIFIQVFFNVNENYWQNGHLQEDWSQMVIQQDGLMASFHCLCLMGSLELTIFNKYFTFYIFSKSNIIITYWMGFFANN